MALTACWLALEGRAFRMGVLALVALAWALPGPVLGLGLMGVLQVLGPGSGWGDFVGAVTFDASAASVLVPFGDSNSGGRRAPQSLLRWDVGGGRWTNVGQCEPVPLPRSAVGRGGRTLFTYGKKIDFKH